MQRLEREQHARMVKDPVWRAIGAEKRELREQLADVAFGYACFIEEGSPAAMKEAEVCRRGIIELSAKIHDCSRRAAERVRRAYAE